MSACVCMLTQNAKENKSRMPTIVTLDSVKMLSQDEDSIQPYWQVFLDPLCPASATYKYSIILDKNCKPEKPPTQYKGHPKHKRDT